MLVGYQYYYRFIKYINQYFLDMYHENSVNT